MKRNTKEKENSKEQAGDRCKGRRVLLRIIGCPVIVLVFVLSFFAGRQVSVDDAYTTPEDVALYVMTYRELPKNYITAEGYRYAESMGIFGVSARIIGGDTYFPFDGLADFDITSSASMKECDIPGEGYSVALRDRNPYRLVYTCNESDVRVFYSENHYGTFREISRFELQLSRNLLWIADGVLILLYLLLRVFFRKRNVLPPPAAEGEHNSPGGNQMHTQAGKDTL